MRAKRFVVSAIIILGAVLGAFLIAQSPPVLTLRWGLYAKQARTRLLCQTDHKALLEACRILGVQVKNGRLEARKYQVLFEPDPEVSSFPAEILDLSPNYVRIDDNGCVVVEMFGALWHFGVVAYPEGFKEPSPNFKYGDRKLIDGLWYNDDRYSSRNPAYDEQIKALLRKCGETRETRDAP